MATLRPCGRVGVLTLAGKVDYDDRQFAVYARGRAVTPAALARWMKVFEGHAPPQRPLAVLDLG